MTIDVYTSHALSFKIISKLHQADSRVVFATFYLDIFVLVFVLDAFATKE